jgi:hypothetical protein
MKLSQIGEKIEKKENYETKKTQQFFDSENFQIPRTRSSLIPIFIFFSKYPKPTDGY